MQKGCWKKKEGKKTPTESRTITRTGIIPVTIPAPGLSKRGGHLVVTYLHARFQPGFTHPQRQLILIAPHGIVEQI